MSHRVIWSIVSKLSLLLGRIAVETIVSYRSDDHPGVTQLDASRETIRCTRRLLELRIDLANDQSAVEATRAFRTPLNLVRCYLFLWKILVCGTYEQVYVYWNLTSYFLIVGMVSKLVLNNADLLSEKQRVNCHTYKWHI